MAMNIQVSVFWVVTPCSDEVGHRRFRGPLWEEFIGVLEWNTKL